MSNEQFRLYLTPFSLQKIPLNLDHPSRRPAQFTLRSLLIAIFALAIIIANWRTVLSFTSSIFWPTTLTVVMLSFVAGQRTRSTVLPNSSRMFRRLAMRMWLLVQIIFTVVVLWSRYRWLASFDDSFWPRAFPYPDAVLFEFHRWIDGKYPAPPGYLKIRGEFYSVLFILNVTAWLAVLISGFHLGLLFRAGIPISYRQWRDRFISVTTRGDTTKR